jgi:hypothetical protein
VEVVDVPLAAVVEDAAAAVVEDADRNGQIA